MKPFHFVMIKPSHYDDDGYVIQWYRSAMPSNTLATLHGIAADCSERKVLGEDWELRLLTIDETNTRVRVPHLVRRIREAGGIGLIGLVGVQSNQFPRAMDLARQFRAAGLQVCIGGFHVSGCLAMLPEMPPELVAAQELGVALPQAGEPILVLAGGWRFGGINDLAELARSAGSLGSTTSVPGLVAVYLDFAAYRRALGVSEG